MSGADTFYKCEECGMTFSSQKEMEEHNKKHIETTGQKTWLYVF